MRKFSYINKIKPLISVEEKSGSFFCKVTVWFGVAALVWNVGM